MHGRIGRRKNKNLPSPVPQDAVYVDSSFRSFWAIKSDLTIWLGFSSPVREDFCIVSVLIPRKIFIFSQ
jgi:hypothetical protein